MKSKSQLATDARDIARDPRWAAVKARNPDADNQFVYAVRTTGIYCLSLIHI